MKLEIKVPSVGESVTEADIETWEKKSGEQVQKGDILVILETDKASMEIPAEQDGVLSILKDAGESVTVGEVIGFIDASSKQVSKTGSKPMTKESQPNTDQEKLASLPRTENFSPSVKRLLATNPINPLDITGSGRGGRLTKGDVLIALESDQKKSKKEIKELPISQNLKAPDSTQAQEQNSLTNRGQAPLTNTGQRRETMTRLRKKTAERLVHSQHSTATLSTFNEVDLSRIIEIRKNYQEKFIKKHNIKLGFMSFFVKSVVSALKQYPKINAFIDGSDILYNDSQHIGIAVSTEKGLVVPVLFNADDLNLAEIEKKIIEYRDKAIARKLTPDDLMGGTFTISNGGVFGSLLSTPILNPPQSGILGMHTIQERPVAINGKVEIRPMMYVTLSYDHQMVDGRESVGFLVKVKEGLEEPARLLIDI